MKQYYLLYCNDLYTIRSGIQLPFICYIAVAGRFTRAEIRLNIHSGNPTPLFKIARRCWKHIYCTSIQFVEIGFASLHFQCFNGLQNLSFVEMWGGGNLNVIVCPYIILFHMIITELLAYGSHFGFQNGLHYCIFKLCRCKTDLCEYNWTNKHCYKTY